MKAVKNGRVEVVNGDEVSRPGPRIDEGLKDLKKPSINDNKVGKMCGLLL